MVGYLGQRVKITEAAGRFASSLAFEEIPLAASSIVSQGFADCIGVIAAGLNEGAALIVADWAKTSSSLSSLLNQDNDASPSDTALILGTAAHALDYDDTGLSGHPSAVLVPAILSVSRYMKSSGGDMIVAYIAGYEIWSDLIARDAAPPHAKGWHPSGIYGCIAAAAATSSLLRLNPERSTHALGIAASLCGGLIANFGSMTKPLHLGRAAQSGVMAAFLARSGMTAASDVIEHPLGLLHAISASNEVDVVKPFRLGDAFTIVNTGLNIKLYPMCYGTHRALDAMIALKIAHSLEPASIRSVNVLIGEAQAGVLRNHRPKNANDAKFSIEFAMAAAAIAGRCGSGELTDTFVGRPDVQSFFERVETSTTPERSADEPALSPYDRVVVALHSGETLEAEKIWIPRGHFKRPVEAQALFEKFCDCFGVDVGNKAVQGLFEQLLSLGSLRKISELSASIANVLRLRTAQIGPGELTRG